MLTKDLVQATARSGRLFPRITKNDDVEALRDATELCAFFGEVVGRVVGEVEEELKANCSTPRRRALAKLLLDRCETLEPDLAVMELRWKAFAVSEELRKKGGLDFLDFSEMVGARLSLQTESLRRDLFSDLSSARQICKFDPIPAEALLEQLNLAQVRTILCCTDEAVVRVKGATTAQKREILRQIKFQRLVSEISSVSETGSLEFRLSGPLKIFGSTSGYSTRFANFFPFIASLSQWSLEANVKWKNKQLKLQLDDKSGLKSRSARSQGSYIPPEFQQLMSEFNERQEFSIKAGDEVVHLGKQNVCFPDFVICSPEGRTFAVELFHKGHQSQLVERIAATQAANSENLIIGVDRALLKDKELARRISENNWFQRYGFEFSQFPTPSLLRKAVSRHV